MTEDRIEQIIHGILDDDGPNVHWVLDQNTLEVWKGTVPYFWQDMFFSHLELAIANECPDIQLSYV